MSELWLVTNFALLNTGACTMSDAASDWAALTSDAFFEIAACLDFRANLGHPVSMQGLAFQHLLPDRMGKQACLLQSAPRCW